MSLPVDIWIDGSCLRNPGGPGGWAAILRYGKQQREISGGVYATTNNRMEMRAFIEALATLKRPCEIIVHTDSRLVMMCATGVLKKSPCLPTKKNRDLRAAMRVGLQTHAVTFNWIRGHSGQPENERCDELARAAASQPTGEDPGFGKEIAPIRTDNPKHSRSESL